MTPEGQYRAATNGLVGERHVFGCSTHNVIDGDIGGVPVEVKSAQVQVKNGWKNPRTAGRFILTNYQHRVLLETDGDYLFVVVHDGKVIAEKRLKAATIERRFKVSERRQIAIPHPKIIRGLLGRIV